MAIEWNGNCQRCGKESSVWILSMFNDEAICLECKEKETKHPRYEEARKADVDATNRGERNFPGVGRPSDL